MGKVAKFFAVGVAVAGVVVGAPSAYAALTDSTNLTQQINNGTIATYIGDAAGDEVAVPNVNFPAKSVSASTQTSTGVFGTNTERIYVDNPGGANNGWTLTFAATSGPGTTWTDGTNTYAFDSATAANGQLAVDPSGGSITADLGTTTGISLGAGGTFNNGVTDSVTLLNAAAGADDINRVYLTGVDLDQTIPAGTPAGTYTIDFTQTVAAL